MRLSIKKHHIRDAQRYRKIGTQNFPASDFCPISLAAKEKFGVSCTMDESVLCVYLGESRLFYQTPLDALDFICEFDNLGTAKETEIEFRPMDTRLPTESVVCDSCLNVAYDIGVEGYEQQTSTMLELGAEVEDHLCDKIEERIWGNGDWEPACDCPGHSQ